MIFPKSPGNWWLNHQHPILSQSMFQVLEWLSNGETISNGFKVGLDLELNGIRWWIWWMMLQDTSGFGFKLIQSQWFLDVSTSDVLLKKLPNRPIGYSQIIP